MLCEAILNVLNSIHKRWTFEEKKYSKLEELLQRCEIAMALHLCLAPTKTRQMRMRNTGGSLPWSRARHHGGRKGGNLLMKQNDQGKGICKITNNVVKHNRTKFNPAMFAQRDGMQHT